MRKVFAIASSIALAMSFAVPAKSAGANYTVYQKTLSAFSSTATGLTSQQKAQVKAAVDANSTAEKFICTGIRYFFYVFIASAFMGFGPAVWLAAALFMAPTVFEAISDRLPNSSFIWRWLPVGLPGLAMILGLEIILENSLSGWLGDHPNFSTIFIFCLLGLLFFINLLGVLGREGRPGEVRLFNQSRYRWLARLGGLVTFIALIQFTSML